MVDLLEDEKKWPLFELKLGIASYLFALVLSTYLSVSFPSR